MSSIKADNVKVIRVLLKTGIREWCDFDSNAILRLLEFVNHQIFKRFDCPFDQL